MKQAPQIVTRDLVRAASCRPGPVASAAFSKIRSCLTPFRRRLLVRYRNVQDLDAILDEALLRAVDSCQSGNTRYLLQALENAALAAAQASRSKAIRAVNPFPSVRAEKHLLDTQLPADDTPETLLENEERHSAVRKAVATAPDSTRQILRLRYWEAKTQQETANLSKLHRLTVLRLEAVALARLKKLLTPDTRTPRESVLIQLIAQ